MIDTEIMVMQTVAVDHACVLTNLLGVPKLYQFDEGVPRSASFPSEATISMDPDWPDNTRLVDAYDTKYGLTIVSSRFCEFVCSLSLQNVEFLPLTLVDHRQRPSGSFFILHPTSPIDCINIAESDVTFDSMDPDSVESFQQLVIDLNRIPSDREIFRIKGIRGAIFAKASLVDRLISRGMSGFTFVGLDEFIYI